MSTENPLQQMATAPSHREQAWRDLGTCLVVLVALGIAGYAVLQMAMRAELPGEDWPLNVPIEDRKAMALDVDEMQQFDLSIFDGKESQLLAAIGEASLPLQLPLGVHEPWQVMNRSELSQWDAQQAIKELRRCALSNQCALQPDSIETGAEDYIRALGRPGDTDADICNGKPRIEPRHTRVPTVIYAIALSRLPQCRSQALVWMQQFADIIARGDLKGSARAQLYAKWALAKLNESLRGPGSAAFLQQIGAVRAEVLADAELRTAYEQFAELPEWGLSMAELRAAWLLASARAAQREVRQRPARLAAQLRELDLLAPAGALAVLQSNPSPGQVHLRNVWCLLNLRAGELPGNDGCFTALNELPLRSSLRCALEARRSIYAGEWRSAPGCDQESGAKSAQRVFERVASTSSTWEAAMRRYQQNDLTTEEHDRLTKYLASYASASGNARAWFAHRYPGWYRLLIGFGLVFFLAWFGWLFALWHMRTLRRFLPPRLAEDSLLGG